MIDAGEGLDFAEAVMALTDDTGADAVIDTVGSPLWPATLRCLGQYGRLTLLGDVSGEAASLRLAEVIFRDAQILGVSGVSLATLRQAVNLAASGQLRPVVSQTLPLTAQGVLGGVAASVGAARPGAGGFYAAASRRPRVKTRPNSRRSQMTMNCAAMKMEL